MSAATDDMLANGIALYQEGKLDEAGQLFHDVLELEPDRADAHSLNGVVLMAKGDTQAAVACFKNAVERNVNVADYHFNLALAYQTLEDMENAEEAVRAALFVRPDYSEAWNLRGQIFDDRKDPASSKDAYEQAIRHQPDYAPGWVNLCGALLKMGDVDQAIEAGERGIKLASDLPLSHFNLASAYEAGGREGDSIAAFRRCFEIDPLFSQSYSSGQAQRGNFKEAAYTIKKHLNVLPDDDPARKVIYNAIYAYAQEGFQFKQGSDGSDSKHKVISSFTQEGFEQYGETFLSSMEKNFVKPTIYFEGDEHPDGYADWKDIQEVPFLGEWIDQVSEFPLMSGRIGKVYHIQFDARFARKSFIQAHALQKYGGKVFWMDADTFVHSKVPDGFLDEMLPDDKFCCYLGRGDVYTESGFLGFNADHALAEPFFNLYINIYLSGAIFTQPHWHDCMGFDVARQILGAPQHFVNIAEDQEFNMHPYVNSVLGKYMDHRKGDRKSSKSNHKDLLEKREEAYWNT